MMLLFVILSLASAQRWLKAPNPRWCANRNRAPVGWVDTCTIGYSNMGSEYQCPAGLNANLLKRVVDSVSGERASACCAYVPSCTPSEDNPCPSAPEGSIACAREAAAPRRRAAFRPIRNGRIAGPGWNGNTGITGGLRIPNNRVPRGGRGGGGNRPPRMD